MAPANEVGRITAAACLSRIAVYPTDMHSWRDGSSFCIKPVTSMKFHSLIGEVINAPCLKRMRWEVLSFRLMYIHQTSPIYDFAAEIFCFRALIHDLLGGAA